MAWRTRRNIMERTQQLFAVHLSRTHTYETCERTWVLPTDRPTNQPTNPSIEASATTSNDHTPHTKRVLRSHHQSAVRAPPSANGPPARTRACEVARTNPAAIRSEAGGRGQSQRVWHSPCSPSLLAVTWFRSADDSAWDSASCHVYAEADQPITKNRGQQSALSGRGGFNDGTRARSLTSEL